MQFVSVCPHECLVLAIRSVQAKPRSQLFGSGIRARVVTHDRIGHRSLVLCKAAEERGFKIGILMAANKPFRQFRDAVKGEVPKERQLDHEVGAGRTGQWAIQYSNTPCFGRV